MSEQTMWAVKVDNGRFDTSSIRFTRKDAIHAFTAGYAVPWPTLYRDGARCVRVRITEVQDRA